MSHRILITGSNGLLGQKLVKLFLSEEIEFLATSFGLNRNVDCPNERYSPMDVTNVDDIESVIRTYKPTSIIHTAAMTNVDQCEKDHKGCDKLNVDSVKNLWTVAKELGCHFQLLSTDFVFDGKKGNYSEEDKPAPLSYYGNSKYLAEQILTSDSNSNWSIVRTIIVYGTGSNLSRSNLVLWAMETLPKGGEMNIVDDQFRAPTWADDLARGCWLIIAKSKIGIFHISGPETRSIYDWVISIAAHFGWSTDNVHAISSHTLNQIAKRPPITGFDLTHSISEIGYTPLPFETTLDMLEEELR